MAKSKAVANKENTTGEEDSASTDEKDKLAAILREAKERWEYHQSVDSENRTNAREDTKFVWLPGAQWPEALKQQRAAENVACLEINQLPQFIKQVVNDQRQVRPSIKVLPAGNGANEEIAKIKQGLIRHIEYESQASAIYDSSFEHAVTGGRGYWRIISEYESEDSFHQRLLIKRIPDPESVRMDPDYQEPDAADAKWCFVSEALNKKDYEAKYPKAQAVSWEGDCPQGVGDSWCDGEKIIIADYFRIVEKPRALALLSDGTTVWKDEVPKGAEVISEREAIDRVVEWHKLSGSEVIESYEWRGKYLPVVMDIGDEITVYGKRYFQGLIRRARDAQQMYNYWQSQATQLIALAPKAPFIGAAGQFEGFEDVWGTANRVTHPYLEYNPIDINGNPVAAPQRTQFAQIPTGIVEQANKCQQDLRATIGIYDPSLGQRSNEISGIAIARREKQGDNATFHFVDNLSRAIALTGRILLDLIPHYYDTDRIVQVLDEEDKQVAARVNQYDLFQGKVINDLTKGKFSVVVSVGPGYETKRLEAVDSMMQFIHAFPQSAQLIGDLIAKNMDWPGSEKIAERLKLMLPPQLQEAEKGKGPPIPPQIMQQMQQLQQQNEGMHQALQKMGQELQAAKSGEAADMHKQEMDARIEAEKMSREDAHRQSELALKRDEIVREDRRENTKIEKTSETQLLQTILGVVKDLEVAAVKAQNETTARQETQQMQREERTSQEQPPSQPPVINVPMEGLYQEISNLTQLLGKNSEQLLGAFTEHGQRVEKIARAPRRLGVDKNGNKVAIPVIDE